MVSAYSNTRIASASDRHLKNELKCVVEAIEPAMVPPPNPGWLARARFLITCVTAIYRIKYFIPNNLFSLPAPLWILLSPPTKSFSSAPEISHLSCNVFQITTNVKVVVTVLKSVRWVSMLMRRDCIRSVMTFPTSRCMRESTSWRIEYSPRWGISDHPWSVHTFLVFMRVWISTVLPW